MEHNLQVIATVSTLPRSSGIASAEASKNYPATEDFPAARYASAINFAEGSNARICFTLAA